MRVFKGQYVCPTSLLQSSPSDYSGLLLSWREPSLPAPLSLTTEWMAVIGSPLDGGSSRSPRGNVWNGGPLSCSRDGALEWSAGGVELGRPGGAGHLWRAG